MIILSLIGYSFPIKTSYLKVCDDFMKKTVLLFSIWVLFLLTGCGTYTIEAEKIEGSDQSPPIEEDVSIYQNDDPLQVHVVYITVYPSNPGSLTRYTFDDVNRDENYRDEDDPELPVLFQEGNMNGTLPGYYGYGINAPNATIKLRGRSTRTADQKSYRVNLDKQFGTWLGFDKINLNKHPYDITRFRNKLAFDIIQKIDHLPSLRTKFIHVFIKDLSGGEIDGDFIDYGLFTHVESVDDDYLKTHGLDKDGLVYKAENFFFQEDKDLRVKTDSKYDKKDFERILSIENGGDHRALIDMVEDVNNYFQSIDTVVQEHLQLDNYLTWLAVNILLDNRDTNTQNFYLYKPKDIHTFYFLPWDYDGALDYYSQVSRWADPTYLAPWRLGLANYWSVPLHSRFFKDQKNIKKLNERINEVYYQLSEMNIPEMIHEYDQVVSPFVSREPDYSNLRSSLADREAEVERLKNIIDINLKRYYDSLEKPMPIFLGDATQLGEYSLFNWDQSYDFQNDDLTYHLEISTTPDFTSVVYDEVTPFNESSVKNLGNGLYYWRVTVIDGKGHIQYNMDEYVDAYGNTYQGVKKYELKERR